MTRGKHQLTFGADYINLRAFYRQYLVGNGQFTFNGTQTGISQADFLLGRPSSYSQDAAQYSDQRQNVLGLYAQDQ